MASQPQVPLTERERDVVLNPDLSGNSDTFVFGKNPDGTPRSWPMKPLKWRHEKHFRKQVMPMMAVLYQPFEVAFTLFASKVVTKFSQSLMDSVLNAETVADDFLEQSVHAILIAYDKDVTADWVVDNAEGRDQMMSIVMKQCELHKVMDKVGESLAERLTSLAQALGIRVDTDSLKRQWKQACELFSASLSSLNLTEDSVGGLFTVSGSGRTSPTTKTPASEGSPEDRSGT